MFVIACLVISTEYCNSLPCFRYVGLGVSLLRICWLDVCIAVHTTRDRLRMRTTLQLSKKVQNSKATELHKASPHVSSNVIRQVRHLTLKQRKPAMS